METKALLRILVGVCMSARTTGEGAAKVTFAGSLATLPANMKSITWRHPGNGLIFSWLSVRVTRDAGAREFPRGE